MDEDISTGILEVQSPNRPSQEDCILNICCTERFCDKMLSTIPDYIKIVENNTGLVCRKGRHKFLERFVKI
jgi:hypothetical protein